MAASSILPLTADDIDDLLYLTRVNETTELQQIISDLAQRHSCSRGEIIAASIDPESENTVLHYACANGFTDLVQLFLSQFSALPVATYGSQSTHDARQLFVNKANKEGNTALHWAAYNGKLDAVERLLEYGADMWIKNTAGHYAMFEAERAERNDVVQYLLEKGGETVERRASGSQRVSEDVEDMDDTEVSMQAVAGSSTATQNGTA